MRQEGGAVVGHHEGDPRSREVLETARAGVAGRLDASAAQLAAAGVPFVVADDSAAFLAHARATGLTAGAR